MTDFTERPLLDSFTVEIREGGYDVVLASGRRCDGLSWDEMLGQIAGLTHPKIRAPHYNMRTPEEWQAWRDDRSARIAGYFDEVKP